MSLNEDNLEFEKWFEQYRSGGSIYDHMKTAWDTACKYKNKEHSNLIDAMTQTSQNNAQLKEMLKEEQEKIKIIIEALEFYADEAHLEMKYSIGNEGNYPLGEYWNDTMCSENGRKAREALAKYRKENT
jgi:hypothetical protein